MAKLFPPHIEGKLPAFINGQKIRIPITMNRAVSANQVGSMYATIKTVQTNSSIVDGLKGESLIFDSKTNSYYAVFDSADSNIKRKFNIGQFYKIQIAYGDKNADDEVGYYSTVGVLKCTSKPEVSITNLTSKYSNSNEFIGCCSWLEEGQDTTEKVYSYCFTLKDSQNNIIATSGKQLHNNYNDVNIKESFDKWSVDINLDKEVLYFITYQVETINGLVVSSQIYPLVQMDTIDPNLPCELVCELDRDEGCIFTYLRPTEKRKLFGNFILARANSKDDYKTWEEIYRFVYDGYLMEPRPKIMSQSKWNSKDILIWEDYTIEQGVSYKYSLQTFNSEGLFSNRVYNKIEKLNSIDELGNYSTYFEDEVIKADFEDAFLFDGERQLKIKFNPKVSSFKTTILESKIDTIGSKYPFIFKNGNVEYKEFPIGGLISLIADSEEKFYKGIQNNLLNISRSQSNTDPDIADPDNWLTANNFYRERNFKLEVLNWLMNGQPKLFRSPGEGNYIVRLMNVSLTPNDTLGRMLHSFQATAYEIADCSFENLNNYNLITSFSNENRYFKIGQIKLNNLPDEIQKSQDGRIIYLDSYYCVNISEATPGTVIKLEFNKNQEPVEIEIGKTGCYIVPIKDDALIKITLIDGAWDDAVLNFCYYDDKPINNFDIITNIKFYDDIKQIIGTEFKDLELNDENKNDIYNVVSLNYGGENYPAFKRISDVKRQPGRFHIIKIQQRPVVVCYEIDNNHYSFNSFGNSVIEDDDWCNTIIYEVHKKDSDDIYYMYGKDKTPRGKPNYTFQLNYGDEIDFQGNPNSIPKTLGRVESIIKVDKVEQLFIGTGIIVDLCYCVKENDYVFENDNEAVKKAKKDFDYEYNNYQNLIKQGENANELSSVLEKVELSYQTYIELLQASLEEWRENHGE